MNSINNNNTTESDFNDADRLRDLSEAIQRYINNFENDLSPDAQRELTKLSEDIRNYGIRLSTEAAIKMLKFLQNELNQLLKAVGTANKFLNEVSQTKQLILAVSKVVDIAANIVKLIPPL